MVDDPRWAGDNDLVDCMISRVHKELSQTLYGQMAESEKLDAVIRKNLETLGYGNPTTKERIS